MTRLEQITALVAASNNEELIRWWKQFTECARKMRLAQRLASKSKTTVDKEKAEDFEKWFDNALLDQKGMFE
jgi:hypothetical protein